MQQYLITVPETKHANFLLNYIIQTGYFERVDKIDEEEFEDIGMLAALNEVNEKDCQEADNKELEAIFNGEFLKENQYEIKNIKIFCKRLEKNK